MRHLIPVVAFSCLVAATPVAAQDTAFAQLAHRIVTTSAGVRPGEVVVLEGGTHTVPLQKLFEQLESSEQGLTGAEARKRLDTYGPNDTTGLKRTSPVPPTNTRPALSGSSTPRRWASVSGTRSGAGGVGGAWAKAPDPIKAVSMVVATATANARAAGRAGAKTNR